MVKIFQARCLGHIKPGGRVSLPPHQKIKDEKAPARMATEPPIPIVEEVSGVIIEGHLPNPRHVEISSASRIQGWKSQGEDVILAGSLVDRRMPNGGCRYARRRILAGELLHD